MKLLSKALIAASFLASFSSNADLITVDEWHDTGGTLGGMKQSSFSDDIYYAVSKFNQLSTLDSYEIMSGYRIASQEEYLEILNASSYVYSTQNPRVHLGQGSWKGYIYNGLTRFHFTFSGFETGDFVLHAGGFEDNFTYQFGNANLDRYYENNTLDLWAGFVLIKDESSDGGVYSLQGNNFSLVSDVPAPFMLSFFSLAILGLSSRKIKLS